MEELSLLVEEWRLHEQYRYRTSWEQTRFIAHKMLIPYSKKKLRLTDIARFSWEGTDSEPDVKPVSKEDYNRMLKRFGES